MTATAAARKAAIPFHQPWLGHEEERAVIGALKAQRLEGNGPMGRGVEARLRELLGVRHALLMSSCTSALDTALEALDVRGGDVLLPSFSFPSTAAAVVGAGARPVFVDIEPASLTLDPEQLARHVSARTRAILYVEYAGSPGALDGVLALADRHRIPLIEDAAHAFGSRYRGRMLGSWGTVGCLSFHGTKLVTCGEGGVFVTNDDGLAQRARTAREYGTNRDAFFQGAVDHYEWVGPGSSRLLAEPLATLLHVQLDKLPEILSRRRRLAERYLQALAPLAEAGLVQLPTEGLEVRRNWESFPILVRDGRQAAALIEALAERGIDARRHFYPLHRSTYSVHCGFTGGELPVSEAVAERLVRLPLYPTLTSAQQTRVIREVVRCLRGVLAQPMLR
jgi:dTDP-4-amino-4,6-dideoxygalactose transaminase